MCEFAIHPDLFRRIREDQLALHYEFNDTIGKRIDKSAKATLRFYNELRKACLTKGEPYPPPSFGTFSEMASGLMKANKELQIDKLRTSSLKDVLEQAWAQKLQNYSTKRLLRDSYDRLLERF